MGLGDYLIDAPGIRIWNAAEPGATPVFWYIFDTVKNNYYFVSGPVWLPVNARTSGDFEAANGDIDQQFLGFRLHVSIAFEICADGYRPDSINVPPQGLTYLGWNRMMNALKNGFWVEFYPHWSTVEDDDTAPSNGYLVALDGDPRVDRNEGQQVSHIVLTLKGTKCMSSQPQEF